MRGKTFKGFIHLLSSDPFTVLFFSPRQLKLFRTLLKRHPEAAIHIDATGKIVDSIAERFPQTRLYHYAGVVGCPDDSGRSRTPLPVFEFITSGHGVANLTHLFQTFAHRYNLFSVEVFYASLLLLLLLLQVSRGIQRDTT
jgi:hypothetical protein